MSAGFEELMQEWGISEEALSAAEQVVEFIPMTSEESLGMEVKDSPIHGKGVFAKEGFPSGGLISGAIRDGQWTAAGRYINHDSYNPNIVLDKGDFMASRDILVGEEILADYAQIKEALT